MRWASPLHSITGSLGELWQLQVLFNVTGLTLKLPNVIPLSCNHAMPSLSRWRAWLRAREGGRYYRIIIVKRAESLSALYCVRSRVAFNARERETDRERKKLAKGAHLRSTSNNGWVGFILQEPVGKCYSSYFFCQLFTSRRVELHVVVPIYFSTLAGGSGMSACQSVRGVTFTYTFVKYG